jgi:hypothetical protein
MVERRKKKQNRSERFIAKTLRLKTCPGNVKNGINHRQEEQYIFKRCTFKFVRNIIAGFGVGQAS